jgi:mono/diheme cytochrome c family protein
MPSGAFTNVFWRPKPATGTVKEKSMNRRFDILFALIVLVGLSAVGSRAVHAQEIFAGGYTQQSGEDLYKDICQGCHMPNAKGAIGAGAYPALANDIRLIAAIYPITVVLNGQRAMPPFGANLSDTQIANVIKYIRTHFGNRYKDEVLPAAVKAARR